MIDKLKQFYTHDYQRIVYAIAVARAEYEKIGSFVTPTLLFLTVIKLFFNVRWYVIPALVIFATITAYWVGKWLIKLGVPKKTAELSNAQNPTLMEILEILRRDK